jgi:hypothetical protein
VTMRSVLRANSEMAADGLDFSGKA